jgi:hypothetical protein
VDVGAGHSRGLVENYISHGGSLALGLCAGLSNPSQ